MKTKLIKHEDYWIVVSDEKPKQNDWYIYNTGEVIEYLVKLNDDNLKKILFSQNPEHNLPTITFSEEVAKELGIVDVEKLAYNWLYDIEEENLIRKYPLKPMEFGYIKAYNQCLSDNADKKFTLEDIKKAIKYGQDFAFGCTNSSDYMTNEELKNGEQSEEEFIQSLTKQEYFCELEMELVEECLPMPNIHVKTGKYQPKIINNSVFVKRIWK
jgi:hypothetical protein